MHATVRLTALLMTLSPLAAAQPAPPPPAVAPAAGSEANLPTAGTPTAEVPAPPGLAQAPTPPGDVAPPAAATQAGPPPTAGMAPGPTALPTPSPATKEQAPLLDQLAVGKQGFFKPSVLFQTWYFYDNYADRADQIRSSFRIRRAEIAIKGEIVPTVIGYRVMIDPAKLLTFQSQNVPVTNQQPAPATSAERETVSVPQPPADTSILQDVYLTWLNDYAEVSVGQFKIPISWEGFNSSAKIIMPERARVSRQFGDRRDLGVRVEKTFTYFGYVLGVYNGAGLNRFDNNDQKDLALRLEGYPMKGIMVGGAGYVGIGQRHGDGTKDRVEADLRIDMAGFLLQAEYIHAWDRVGRSGPRIEGHGAYGALAYTLLGRLQPVVRVGFLDTNVDVDVPAGNSDELVHYDIGLNYYLLEHQAKLQGSLSMVDYDNANSLLYEGIVAGQVSF